MSTKGEGSIMPPIASLQVRASEEEELKGPAGVLAVATPMHEDPFTRLGLRALKYLQAWHTRDRSVQSVTLQLRLGHATKQHIWQVGLCFGVMLSCEMA